MSWRIITKFLKKIKRQWQKLLIRSYKIRHRDRPRGSWWKRTGAYNLQSIQWSVILTAIGLIWFLMVPAPGLFTARVLDYSLPVNYIQLYNILFYTGLGLALIFGLGIILYHAYWGANQIGFKLLYRRYTKYQSSMDPSMRAAAASAIEGYRVWAGIWGVTEAWANLRELFFILWDRNNPNRYYSFNPERQAVRRQRQPSQVRQRIHSIFSPLSQRGPQMGAYCYHWYHYSHYH